ncbi:uncharacterized protein LACBIDRAFT_318953 [Laccaria bicolor S238N-H82]|uniref:Predicted protein n=1 Tax=Laccaria bicolor (strain S238N-H82 / ATCC MYA-4686) TaxID=486041 RepID=B0D7I4_LACBS|nr:uncharacterized protein LACBIDRAFT_318953 [Laccaria bicolor S238N-H82]EDR09659.1 predicted protein [Laccaria bicolor S238N-H82]|eukprot:XP_001880008.1 predicted protein [Laccaria bicolor S238N-H82]
MTVVPHWDRSDAPKSEPVMNQPHTRYLLTAVLAAFALLLYHAPNAYILCSPSNNIYTVDPAAPRVACISVRGDRVYDIGPLHELQAHIQTYFLPLQIYKWLNLMRVVHIPPDAVVVPGLTGPFLGYVPCHMVEYDNRCPCAYHRERVYDAAPIDGDQFDSRSAIFVTQRHTKRPIKDVVDRVKQYIQTHPDVYHNTSRWIEGMGWDQTKWPERLFPTASDLDQDPLLKGRLISLSRIDGHARWVSPAVLELMNDLPKEVEGGQIVRGEQGKPTGIFVDNAMNLIPIPHWTERQISDFFDSTIKEALSRGLTSIHDADSKLDHLAFFKKMAERGKLPNRIYAMGNVPSDEYWGDQIPRLINYGKHRRLNVRGVKLYADGALGSWGAALLEPYSDNPSTSGLMLSSPETLGKLVQQFWRDGWQTNIHCIGDRANNVILDVFENVLNNLGGNVTEWRPRIEHAQIFSQADLKRMVRLGASVQPTHATSDMGYAETRLGPERIRGAYAYKTLLKASPANVLPLGSDFPVEGVNPLLGFYAAVSRLAVDGSSPHGDGGWFPDERLTRAEALKGMTLDAAYASFAEKELGSLSPGKKADFVVFDRDIMTIPVNEILEAKVKATVVDGGVVYGTL